MTGRAAPARISAAGAAALLMLTGCAGAPEKTPPASAPAPESANAAPAAAPASPAPAPEAAAPAPDIPETQSAPETQTAALPPPPVAPETPEAPAAPAAPPVTEPEEPAFSVFIPTPAWTEADLAGRTADAVQALLGAPDFVRADPPAAYWRYGAGGCALDVFLYADAADAPRTVRHTGVRWDAGAGTAAQCLDRLRRAHRAPDGGAG